MRNLTLGIVAKALGIDSMTLAQHIQHGVIPGAACYQINKNSPSKRYSYVFYPEKIREFYGDDVYNEIMLSKKLIRFQEFRKKEEQKNADLLEGNNSACLEGQDNQGL